MSGLYSEQHALLTHSLSLLPMPTRRLLPPITTARATTTILSSLFSVFFIFFLLSGLLFVCFSFSYYFRLLFRFLAISWYSTRLLPVCVRMMYLTMTSLPENRLCDDFDFKFSRRVGRSRIDSFFFLTE